MGSVTIGHVMRLVDRVTYVFVKSICFESSMGVWNLVSLVFVMCSFPINYICFFFNEKNKTIFFKYKKMMKLYLFVMKH